MTSIAKKIIKMFTVKKWSHIFPRGELGIQVTHRIGMDCPCKPTIDWDKHEIYHKNPKTNPELGQGCGSM